MAEFTSHDASSPVLYEVKSSQDKGLGLFATQIIPKGTRILSEKPLIKIARTDLGSVVSIFGTLSEEDKTFIKSLYCLPAIFVKRKSELERQRAGQSTAMQIAQILATFQTNCFRLDTVSGQYSGLFREASRINHACADNVFCYWNNESGEQTIHAIKTIAKGEELLSSYVNIYQNKAARKEHLKSYDIRCKCPICDESTTFGRASLEKREQLWAKLQEASTHRDETILRPFRAEHERLAIVMEIIGLLHEIGMVGPDLTAQYRRASHLNAVTGDFTAAADWADKALESAVICVGRDPEQSKDDEERARAYREGMKAATIKVFGEMLEAEKQK